MRKPFLICWKKDTPLIYKIWVWEIFFIILHYKYPQGSYKTWMSLNLKTKIQGLECPWICKEVLECPWILLALVFGYFLKLFDIQDGHFIELILHVHIWPHYKVTFWTIQRHILLISNAFSSVFSPWICWYMALNVLEKSLNLTLPDMYEPCTQRNYIYQRLDTNSCFAKLRAISNLFSFFLYSL